MAFPPCLQGAPLPESLLSLGLQPSAPHCRAPPAPSHPVRMLSRIPKLPGFHGNSPSIQPAAAVLGGGLSIARAGEGPFGITPLPRVIWGSPLGGRLCPERVQILGTARCPRLCLQLGVPCGLRAFPLV